jgi:chorismate mutase
MKATNGRAMTKTEDPMSPQATLDLLRAEIDRIDRELHSGLIERGEIIDRLIAAKARQTGVSAFRPAREAEMMRRLVTRHRGILPLATVESIWRIIISTFTYVQAPYTVHIDAAGGDVRMRDSARFHFGFTVPLSTRPATPDVIASVAAAEGDLGLIRVDDRSSPWWEILMPPAAPKIIARLPFVERLDHAAGLPLFIVARPPQDGASRDVLLYAVQGAVPPEAPVVGDVVASFGSSLIVATPDGVSANEIASRFGKGASAAFIGSHAARFEMALEP